MAVEKLELETYFGKCKCCLNYGYLRTMWEQHVVDDVPETYGQMLIECFSIEWTVQNSKEDDQICEECVWKLREAFSFKKKVLECQKELTSVGGQDDEAMEVKSEDESYAVEYLDEDYLDYENNTLENSYEESLDERESVEEKQSPEDEDSLVYNDNEDDENYNPQDKEDPDTDNSLQYSPRKRKVDSKSDVDDSDTEPPKPKWPKKLPKQERWKTYKQYTEGALSDAVEAVIGRSMNQKDAAKRFKVPRKTLSVKVLAVRSDEESEREPTSRRDRLGSEMVLLNKHRENMHSVLQYSNATPFRDNCSSGYICAFCNVQCRDPSTLKQHTYSHPSIADNYIVKHVRTHSVKLDITNLQCTLCNNRIQDLETLMRHLKSKHDKPINFDIKNHIVPYAFESDEIKCVQCGQRFDSFRNITEHMSDVHFRNYECDKCGRGFVNRSALVTHDSRHRRGLFHCQYCSKVYSTNLRKTEHERVVHIKLSKTRKCAYCDEKFVDKMQKTNHETAIHGAPRPEFKCNACTKSFPSKRLMQIHVQNVHLMRRPHHCTVDNCGKKFPTSVELQAHLITHTNDKPFECVLCPRKYKSKKALNSHKHYHIDKRQFNCRMCTKRYMHEDNLKLHLDKIHDIR